MTLRRLLSLSTLILTVLTSNAQNFLRDEQSIINFDNGIGFQTPDKRFGLNLRFRMQNRLGVTTYNDKNLDVKQIDAYVRRMRLRFDGYVINQKLTYTVQLSFSRSDIDFANVTYPQIIRDAMVYYNFNPNFYIGIGQGKLPGNRQRVISSGSLQFVDRSDVNGLFTLDRDYGIFAYKKFPVGKSEFILKGALSTGEGRINEAGSNKIATTVRGEYLPFGGFAKFGDYSEGDIAREQTPKLSFGAGYSVNSGTTRTAGQLGAFMKETRWMEYIFADMIFKYRGIAVEAEYMQRNTGNPVVTGLDSKPLFIYKGNGTNVQASYCFKSNYEIAGRYSKINPDEQIRSLTTPYDVYGLGVSKYITGHRTKLQFNLFYKDQPAIGNLASKSNYSAIFQVELGI
ncbi:MAG: porin [Bacteroidota bacterium]